MFHFVVLFGLLVLPFATAQLTINTPSASSLVVCEPVLLTWSGGVPPYILTIVAPGQGAIYETLTSGTTSETQLVWDVDLAPGTNMNFAIKDSTGAQQFTSTVTVQQNPSDQSCPQNSIGLGGATPSSTTATKPSTSTSTKSSATTSEPVDTHTSDPGTASHPDQTSTAPSASDSNPAATASNPSIPTSKASSGTGGVGNTSAPNKSLSTTLGSSATVSSSGQTSNSTGTVALGGSNLPGTSTSPPPSPSDTNIPVQHSQPVAAIAGGTVGGVVLLSAAMALCIVRRRRRRTLAGYDTRTVLDKEDLDASPSTQSLATGDARDIENRGSSAAGPVGRPEDPVVVPFLPRKARLDRAVAELSALEDRTQQPSARNDNPVESERERSMQHQMDALQAEVQQLRAALVMETGSIPPAYEGPPEADHRSSIITHTLKSRTE